MNCRRFIKRYPLLLLLLVKFQTTTSVSPLNAVNATKSPDEPRIEKSCLKYDYQIHDALTSTKPPLDNYFNISNAIYPSEDSSSKLINIWVHFINSTVNLTEVEQLKFIWSRSCLYVSDRYLSLQAMSLYSLATIWPHRRQEDLHITINEFCNPHEKTRKLLQFLSTVRIQYSVAHFTRECYRWLMLRGLQCERFTFAYSFQNEWDNLLSKTQGR